MTEGITSSGGSRRRQGEIVWLPPQVDTFHPAESGAYRLRSTGEVVGIGTGSWGPTPPYG